MLTTARKAMLLDRLRRDGHLQVGPLAQELDLSEDTLRRDLRDLSAEGLLVRVHGGAVPASPTHQSVAVRRGIRSDEKQRLARAAAGLVRDGQVVLIDGGTTHALMAAAIPLDRRCTVVTHSPAIALSFEAHERVEIVLLGGRLFRHSMVALGPETGEAYGRIRADVCFLGVTGVHPELGLTTGDAAEAALKRLMVRAAADCVVVATADKLERASPWEIAPLSTVSTLVSLGERPAWLPPGAAHLGTMGA